MDNMKKLGSSFDRIVPHEHRAVKLIDLCSFLKSRTIGDDHFKSRVTGFLAVLYMTLDAIAPFELDHHGPVTTGLLKKYCSKDGMEKLKKMVTYSRIKYRKDISTSLEEILGMSAIFLDTISSSARSAILDYSMEMEVVHRDGSTERRHSQKIIISPKNMVKDKMFIFSRKGF
jgi:hypothetical protein